MKKMFIISIVCIMMINFVGCNADKKENLKPSQKNDVDLIMLVSKLNSDSDKAARTEDFKLIKIVTDPLCDIPNDYEGSEKTSDNQIMSVSYGVEGTFKITETATLHVVIIKDDTIKNGGFISTRFDKPHESSVFKHENTFLIFEVYEKSSDEKLIIEDGLKITEFSKKFLNMYKTILPQVIK